MVGVVTQVLGLIAATTGDVSSIRKGLAYGLAASKEKIQGDLDKAEQTRNEAESQLAEYRESLAGARDEANRIIEEARSTAESMRRDLQAKAEQESQSIVARAQEEIRAERDR